MKTETVGERLTRLEQFAKETDPDIWGSLLPREFVKGDLVRSNIPRHAGLTVKVDSMHRVGDDDVYRCLAEDGDIHLFRYHEMTLVTPSPEST